MVYCGRPSTSCNNCRAKKRRCDKAHPECGQCRRMGQKCPGYRDPSSLIFRDESSQVIDKARSRLNKRSASASQQSSQPASAQRSPPTSHPSRAPRSQPSPHHFPPQRMSPVEDMLGDMGEAMFASNSFNFDLLGFNTPFNTDGGLFTLSTDSSDAMMTGTDPASASAIHSGAVSAVDVPRDYPSHRSPTGMELASTAASPNGSSHEGSIQRPLSLPLDMIGLDFFLTHYVVHQSGPSTGFLDYVVTILAREEGHELLEGAVLAVGFSGLARTTKQTDLMCRSIMMYTHTMERVNRALADPVAARRDSTIVTVLVLALYEFSKASLDGWKQHIDGAVSLLNVRGKSQFATTTGLQIFKDVFTQLLTNCLRIGVPMPSSLRMLRTEASKAFSVSDPYWIGASAMVELLDLYHQISPGGYTYINHNPNTPVPNNSSSMPALSSNSSKNAAPNLTIEELERFLSQALDIDYRLESSFAECPPEWCYAVMPNPPAPTLDTTRFHGEVHHLYHDVYIANVWNRMRTCRILANHAIGYLLLRGANIDPNWFFSNNYVDRLQGVSKTMAHIRADLLAAVPQLMGYVTSPAQQQVQHEQQMYRPRGMTPVATSDSGIDVGDATSPPYSPTSVFGSSEPVSGYTGSAAGCYFATWVLLTVGCMHSLTDETRAWTVTQLRRISTQAGFTQADDFAKFVEHHNLRPPLK
ncbi:C6 finger domain protein [Beauveria bassiana ARSEF 2860]|uniref:C6 finger domain protein n=1 Tax=Beauveria bassiana (strain ARSEF 2860) TaxID=655819 RepID=J4UM24_BEAB2|nr:C6 finger domain protein [Beauveria bassiana ARSEF 2860]EJP65767.1 C6 finger domain protein [Beauveria bassiana ARSEF 2860]